LAYGRPILRYENALESEAPFQTDAAPFRLLNPFIPASLNILKYTFIFLMLSSLIALECVSLLAVMASVKAGNGFSIIEGMMFCLLAYSIYKITSFGQLIWAPEIQLSPGVTNATVGMLDCLNDHYSWIDTYGLQKCVLESSVYNISNGRLPYLRDIPVAFVIVNLFASDIFIVDKYYSSQNDINQALILIHECSHLTLSTIDYAYRWQPEFALLDEDQHMANADSYVDIIVNTCLIDTDASFL
jgi:hypothetical protein